MRISKCKYLAMSVVLSVLIICLASWFFGCDGRRPAAPDDGDPVTKDYAVYAKFSYGIDSMLVYYPLSRHHDTVIMPYDARHGMKASADGSRLYLAQQDGVLVVDTDSFAEITKLPYTPRGNVAVSPDNELIAIPGDGLHILRTSDYELLFSDTSGLFNRRGFARFSDDCRFLYVAGGWDNPSPEVSRIDLSDGSYTVTVRPFAEGVSEVVPTPDGSRWILALGGGGFGGKFAVYDIAADSIIFDDYHLAPSEIHVEITPDGKYGFGIGPGDINPMTPEGPNSLMVFDLQANQILKEMPTLVEINGIMTDAFSPAEMGISPDGNWMVIGSWWGQILRLDLRTLTFDDYLNLGSGNRFIADLAVQSGP